MAAQESVVARRRVNGEAAIQRRRAGPRSPWIATPPSVARDDDKGLFLAPCRGAAPDVATAREIRRKPLRRLKTGSEMASPPGMPKPPAVALTAGDNGPTSA
jgi:hypothetical protein